MRIRNRVQLTGNRVGQGQNGRRGSCTISNTDIVKELALPPVKIHCSVLAEDAIRAAITATGRRKNNVGEMADYAVAVTAQ